MWLYNTWLEIVRKSVQETELNIVPIMDMKVFTLLIEELIWNWEQIDNSDKEKLYKR